MLTSLKDIASGVFAEFRQVFLYKALLKNLVARDLKVRYKRSILGFLWVMLNPLLTMVVLYGVFSTLFKQTVPNYTVYLITGIIMWNMFSQATSCATTSFTGDGDLLKKIYLPKAILPVSTVASGFINFCFSLVPLFLIFIVTGTVPNKLVFLLPLCLAEVVLFTLGVALFLATVTVFFHDMFQIYQVVLLAWVYLTPVFYPLSILPPAVAELMQFNPMYHYIAIARALLYGSSVPYRVLMSHFAAGAVFALASFAVGTFIYMRNREKIVFYL